MLSKHDSPMAMEIYKRELRRLFLGFSDSVLDEHLSGNRLPGDDRNDLICDMFGEMSTLDFTIVLSVIEDILLDVIVRDNLDWIEFVPILCKIPCYNLPAAHNVHFGAKLAGAMATNRLTEFRRMSLNRQLCVLSCLQQASVQLGNPSLYWRLSEYPEYRIMIFGALLQQSSVSDALDYIRKFPLPAESISDAVILCVHASTPVPPDDGQSICWNTDADKAKHVAIFTDVLNKVDDSTTYMLLQQVLIRFQEIPTLTAF